MGSRITIKPTIDTFLTWAYDAISQHNVWHKESWEDVEFRDGLQWAQADKEKLINKGINPLTVNRIFPILNLIHGNYIRSQKDIIAKGRTKEDSELAQVASESIAYVIDQNGGTALQREAFENAILSGFGCIYTGFNSDPRKENILLRSFPWYSVWWDPYASPWFSADTCRYVFTAEWKDIEDLKMFFPKKAKEIDETCKEITAAPQSGLVPSSTLDDVGASIENYKRFLSTGQWVNTERRRVRPIEMWYTVIEPTWFAIMPDGQVFDIDLYPVEEQYKIVTASKELQQAYVKKMHVVTFIGNLILQDTVSPFPHSEYPFTPFIGYLDRFNFPFGVPRQIKEQNMEVNKRRSMALALISSRRTTVESDAAEDLNTVQAEANRMDGFIVMKKGKLQAIDIQEMSALATPQIEMMRQSEIEIKEIVGASDESLGYDSPAQSGVSLDKKKQFSNTMTLSLMENAYRSQKMLGEKVLALIQGSWNGEKVMRVIDRLSGVEKFVEINKRVYDESGAITVKNDITQGRFDLIISTKDITDTMREKNMDLLFSAINKAPAEAVAPLLNVAFELSDIPEKDRILDKIRLATGQQVDEDLTADQRKQQMAQIAQQQAQKAQKAEAQQDMMTEVEARKKEAEINKLNAEGQAKLIEANATKQQADQDGFAKGHEIATNLLEFKKKNV